MRTSGYRAGYRPVPGASHPTGVPEPRCSALGPAAGRDTPALPRTPTEKPVIPLLFLLSYVWLPTAFRRHTLPEKPQSLLPALVLAVLLAASYGFAASPAHAGWLDWFGRDKKLEQANTALQHAADAVNASAKLQADQNVQVLEAVQALSRERMQLAGHLQQLGQFTAEDSQLAAALTLLGPTLIGVAVLAVGAYALRLAFRDEPTCEAALLELLMEKDVPEASLPRPDDTEALAGRRSSRISIARKNHPRLVKSREIPDTSDPQEMPF